MIPRPTEADYIPYHTGEARHADYDPKSFRRKAPPIGERRVIAWDMEGISLSGQEKPQHAVLFGCSAEVDSPLTGWRLSGRDMLRYIVDVGERYPHALHVGFAFKYDANMIIHCLTEGQIIRLWRKGNVTFKFADDPGTWSIKWIPGKMFTVSRRWGSKRNTRAKTSVTIYDFSSFFGDTFLNVAEQILSAELSEDDRDVIAHGKQARGQNTWDGMPEVIHYWQREIVLIQRVFERFRAVMAQAGFNLKEWYGPGALANYINAVRKLRPHMGAAQTTSGAMPAEVHAASKVAFSGGRFEVFQVGRIQGPIVAADINSAYPYAMTLIPSLHPDDGEWIHVERPSTVARFGVYRMSFRAPNASPVDYRPMPLFWRDRRGGITYPVMSHGWYWSPEAALIRNTPGIQIHEGWEWRSNEDTFPWAFLQDMYDTRMRLGKKNLLSMPFKLGPNSLYGKYAQTVGWDKKKRLPPKSHALPIAGWVTSYCRAMLWNAIRRAPDKVVAVETDAIYTTAPLDVLGLNIGDGLGQWGVKTYDEMMYLQSGMYHYKVDGEWIGTRARGIPRAQYPPSVAADYLRSLDTGEWGPITLPTKPRFIGAGAAIAASEPTRDIMTSWRDVPKILTLGDTGKRLHVPGACSCCRDGVGPYDAPHRLAIRSTSDGMTLSHPRAVPWEQPHPAEVQEIRDKQAIEREMFTR